MFSRAPYTPFIRTCRPAWSACLPSAVYTAHPLPSQGQLEGKKLKQALHKGGHSDDREAEGERAYLLRNQGNATENHNRISD